MRLLFRERFKELHAEVPPLSAYATPPLLMAGAVRTADDDSDMGELTPTTPTTITLTLT